MIEVFNIALLRNSIMENLTRTTSTQSPSKPMSIKFLIKVLVWALPMSNDRYIHYSLIYAIDHTNDAINIFKILNGL